MEYQKLIHQLCSSSKLPVLVTTKDGRLLHINESAHPLLSNQPPRWKKTFLLKVAQICTYADSSPIADFSQLLYLLSIHPANSPLQVRITTASGIRIYLVQHQHFANPDNGETEHLLTLIDNTKIMRLEESLHKSEKAEAIGFLAGSLAHDFNNLLSLISSYSDLLMMNLDVNSPLRHYAQSIGSSAHKGTNLIKTFSAISKHNGGTELTETNLRDLVNGVENLLGRALGNKISIINHFDVPDPIILGDPIQLELAIINLFINARDAMDGKGQVDVYLRDQILPEGMIEATICGGEYIVLAIQDTGCGIDPAIREEIFEPFFTTKPNGKGTGLGLSTVRTVMDRCGGFILVDSKPGEGARFELFFPA